MRKNTQTNIILFILLTGEELAAMQHHNQATSQIQNESALLLLILTLIGQIILGNSLSTSIEIIPALTINHSYETTKKEIDKQINAKKPAKKKMFNKSLNKKGVTIKDSVILKYLSIYFPFNEVSTPFLLDVNSHCTCHEKEPKIIITTVS